MIPYLNFNEYLLMDFWFQLPIQKLEGLKEVTDAEIRQYATSVLKNVSKAETELKEQETRPPGPYVPYEDCMLAKVSIKIASKYETKLRYSHLTITLLLCFSEE